MQPTPQYHSESRACGISTEAHVYVQWGAFFRSASACPATFSVLAGATVAATQAAPPVPLLQLVTLKLSPAANRVRFGNY